MSGLPRARPHEAEQLALALQLDAEIAPQSGAVGFVESERARGIFESDPSLRGRYPLYDALIDAGWPWRVAVYIAWASLPSMGRVPKTQGYLATEVLGLASDRVIRKWRAKNPAIDDMVARVQAEQLFDSRADVIHALVTSATNTTYRNYRDRELFLKLTGDYTPSMHVTNKLMTDKTELTEAELTEIAARGKEDDA